MSVVLAGAVAALNSCAPNEGWKLEGTAPDGVDTVIIQAPTTAGGWYALDSVTVNEKGIYTFSLPHRAKSEIYRVILGEKSVYVPADSTETVTLNPDGVRGGSTEALLFNAVDSAFSAGGDARSVLQALNGGYASTAAYYATRLMPGNMLILRTVTNRYSEERADDPRTAVLRAELQRRKRPVQPSERQQQVILADEIAYYDIELMDREGKMRKLSEVVDSNPVAVLAYVDFTSDTSQAITRALGDASGAGAGIYEIGFSENQYLWADASQGLPWVCVYQSDAGNTTHISQYAVGSFPTFFIFKNGEIVERISDYTKLAETVNKYK